MTLDQEHWWSSLYHIGLLIAPSKLATFFPDPCPPLDERLAMRLRSHLARLAGDPDQLGPLLDTVLEDLLGLDAGQWQKGSAVDPEWSRKLVTGETERPRRVWAPLHKGRLPVFVDDESAELGVGRGRRKVARVLDWLRSTQQPIALLTNGRKWRLIHAGLDYEAWCEWDSALWFIEGGPGPQLVALRTLIGRDALRPDTNGRIPLLAAIQASREGQAELSMHLGERVRQAVELLIQASSGVLGDHPPRAIYIAATRLIMRCVVLLFAEARSAKDSHGAEERGLLPRDNPIYRDSYSIQGLREQLDRAAGGRGAERLRLGHSAWPRLMSLFRLVYHGSSHEKMPIARYGGGLFFPCYMRPGDKPERPLVGDVERALEALEDPRNTPNDAVVHAILELLTRSPVQVRQGRRSTWVVAPVDFSDLSSEYIGILYEGLLDFELRRAPIEDAMVFLNLGAQPVLPFARLDAMTEREMAAIVNKFKTVKKSSEEEDDESEDDEEAPEPDADEVPVPEDSPPDLGELDDQRRIFTEKVQTWAEKAVKAAGIVKYRKSSDPRAREAFENEARTAARQLIRRVVFPGEWYLVRWGGTRKGAGTFYTRPQLAGPTTRRTLAPLLTTPGDERGPTPEAILALKICDPAMGSGSFLISALRVLTEALLDSLYKHDRLVAQPARTIARLADGQPLDHPSQETLPLRLDDPNFRPLLRARLMRHVVERCIYGVELDPLAVELARMALWIETMDERLPFEFLDHKLKCGNSLVGAWIDRVLDFPALCSEREAGDEKHEKVHCEKGERSRAIRAYRDNRVKPELRRWIDNRTQGQLVEHIAVPELRAIHEQALILLREIHDLPIHEVELREEKYKALQDNPAIARLREMLDRWCALWFWPAGQMSNALGPLTALDPGVPAPGLAEIREHLRFFHWEIEFPDAFTGPDSGFHAIIGNPPWETQKPNSMEFFSNIDPLYRTYDKQQALRRQRELFQSDPAIERDWLDYVGHFKSLYNWFHCVAWPYGDTKNMAGPEKDRAVQFNLMEHGSQYRESDRLHALWRDLRKDRPHFSDPRHPYQHQGGADVNSYKLFLEQAYALLRPDGRLGLLVPSGIYTDKATNDLRKLFLEHGRWTHLYALQNERFVFGDIDHRFKVAIVIVTKGGQTETIATRFRIGPGDSPEAHEVEADLLDDARFLSLTTSRIHHFSPTSGTILEIRDAHDLAILEKLYGETSGTVLLGDQEENGWKVLCSREFHMTDDSKLFPTRARWEAEGYRPSEYGIWLRGTWRKAEHERAGNCFIRSADRAAILSLDDVEDIAFPFYQGIMVQQFDFAPKTWVSGTGLRALWRETPWDGKVIGSQFLMARTHALARASRLFKLGLRRVARSTDTRTAIAALIPGMPCGDKITIVDPSGSESMSAALAAIMNSLSLDWVVRLRSGGTQLDHHSLLELPMPRPHNLGRVASLCLRLNGAASVFARLWESLMDERRQPWRRLWAVTPHERLRLRCALDAIVAYHYGLSQEDFAWILRDCDHPVERVCNAIQARAFDPKGFWRVDKEQPPELRHPVLAQIAFHDLQRRGLDAFLAQNDGEGWMLPETLRLSDYGLGHDERARAPQPVAAALGPRFLSWQLEQSVEESWEECRRHAELIARIIPPPPPAPKPAADSSPTATTALAHSTVPASADTPEPAPASAGTPAAPEPATAPLWPDGVYANIEPIQGKLLDPGPTATPAQGELFHLGPKPKRRKK